MPKVLHIVNRWKKGGVERFIEGLVDDCCDVEQEILSVCTDVASDVDCPKYGPMHEGESMPSMLLGAKALDGFLSSHRFDVVHIHTQNSSGFLYAAVAKRNGVACRIIHSHNTSLGAGAGLVKKSAQVLFRRAFGGAETVRLACSTEAGRHLFGRKRFTVVPNGVDLERFAFDGEARREIRKSLGLDEGAFLVGCVGSLIEAKNHMRAVSVFGELRKTRGDASLLILGEGKLRGLLEAEVERRDLGGSVIMPGFVEEPHRWYSAMDVVLLPSLYEGLPISLVEAQCNGLPVVCSDSVTREVALLDSFRFLSLDDEDGVWANSVLCVHRHCAEASVSVVRKSGFGRETTLRLMSGVYSNA